MDTTLTWKSCGHELDMNHVGEIKPSADALGDRDEFLARLERDGYLYIPGFFPRDEVLEVRATLTSQLASRGLLNSNYPHLEAVWNPEHRTCFDAELAKNNKKLESLVYGPKLLGFYRELFDDEVLHFTYTWLRAVGPGPGTHPHCDLPYMGRGTRNLLTAWIPYADVPLQLGGLMVLEGSHRQSDRIRHYLESDVDSHCTNRPEHVEKVAQGKAVYSGALSNNPASLREKFGGRWLTANWQAGDFITFKMNLIHASLDNQTDRIRLSSDTRYQSASEPADDRWIGAEPIGNTTAAKRGRIC